MTIHVIGAGLAGLAAALACADAGHAVTIYESGPACGGRCRSFFDKELGVRLDNGNHLLLSGNQSAMRYLDRLGTRHSLAGPDQAIFPFFDVRDGRRWALRLSEGRLPLWLFDRASRIPGVTLRDWAGLLRLARSGPADTVAARVPPGPLAERLIEPLAIAALNTMPAEGSARLLWAIVRETLGRGGRYCRPLFPKEGLSESFVDPAIAALTEAGATLRTGCRVARLEQRAGAVAALHLAGGETIALEPADKVILAVPAQVAPALLQSLAPAEPPAQATGEPSDQPPAAQTAALTAPDAFESILNVHFRIAAPAGEAGLYGLIGGLAEWVFVKPGVVSITVSAANRHQDIASETLAGTVWREAAACLGIVSAPPPWRVIREKRATFAATPAQQMRRPSATTALPNLVLAGDWTDTGLPATIEGAIRSGFAAAHIAA